TFRRSRRSVRLLPRFRNVWGISASSLSVSFMERFSSVGKAVFLPDLTSQNLQAMPRLLSGTDDDCKPVLSEIPADRSESVLARRMEPRQGPGDIGPVGHFIVRWLETQDERIAGERAERQCENLS